MGKKKKKDKKSEIYKPVPMGLVNRVFPSLFANSLVGVQPMTGPMGTAFAMRYGFYFTHTILQDFAKQLSELFNKVVEYETITESSKIRFFIQSEPETLLEFNTFDTEEIALNTLKNCIRVNKIDMLNL